MAEVICNDAYNYDWCGTCRHSVRHSEDKCDKDHEGTCRCHIFCRPCEEEK